MSYRQIKNIRALVCSRREAALTEIAALLQRFGASATEAGDPAAALSAAANASPAYDFMVVDGSGLHFGDLELLRRVCEMFGAPRLPLALIKGDIDSPALSAALRAVGVEWADAQAVGGLKSISGEPAPGGSENAARILLVEDNQLNQLVAVGMLTSLGHQSHVAANGAEGVAAAATGAFALVLMDVRMPVMDGLEATRRIRALPPPMGNVPIVAVTANAMRGDQEACLAAGMNDYLVKPIRVAVLEAALKRWLPQR